jgi:heme A synthase
MTSRNQIAALLLVVTALGAHATDNKALYHYISLPIIEGAGIYGSIASLTDDHAGGSTKAAAITNLALLGTNATLGMITAMDKGNSRPKLRVVHRIIACTVTAAALWLGISGTVDKVAVSTQAVSYSYTALTTVPIIMFSF